MNLNRWDLGIPPFFQQLLSESKIISQATKDRIMIDKLHAKESNSYVLLTIGKLNKISHMKTKGDFRISISSNNNLCEITNAVISEIAEKWLHIKLDDGSHGNIYLRESGINYKKDSIDLDYSFFLIKKITKDGDIND